ncbi:MAG: hypothetical protein R3349_02195 [Geminicoccaceae bacterium]|nr:hypothetical protein [Geminicoccaceae bacterium]
MIRAGARLGIVTGSRIEARCVGADPRFLVACSGADPASARDHARRLIEQDIEGLISFGLAGGLDPSLRPGALLLPETVIGPPSGGRPCPVFEASPAERAVLHERLAGAGLQPVASSLLGSERLVGSPARKAELFRTTGAVAVDMESHVVAEVAAAAGLPWLVLRAIADPADLALPSFIGATLGPEGGVRRGAVLRGLLRQPAALPSLIRLHRHSRRGLGSLARAARLVA